MNWDALIFIAVGAGILFWIESKFNRVIGQLEDVNKTLASILEQVGK